MGEFPVRIDQFKQPYQDNNFLILVQGFIDSSAYTQNPYRIQNGGQFLRSFSRGSLVAEDLF